MNRISDQAIISALSVGICERREPFRKPFDLVLNCLIDQRFGGEFLSPSSSFSHLCSFHRSCPVFKRSPELCISFEDSSKPLIEQWRNQASKRRSMLLQILLEPPTRRICPSLSPQKLYNMWDQRVTSRLRIKRRKRRVDQTPIGLLLQLRPLQH